MAKSPPSPSKEAEKIRAAVRRLQKRTESDGYRAGVAWSLDTAFPVSECGSFTGLLGAIDEAERQRSG